MSSDWHVYAVCLKWPAEDGSRCYYVGKSKNVQKRIADHKSGKSNIAWIKNHGGVDGVINIGQTLDTNGMTEMYKTVELMMQHGLNNVRGSEWTRDDDLTEDEIKSVRTFALGTWDLCRTCGNPGHFAKECNMPKVHWMDDGDSDCSQYEESDDSQYDDFDDSQCDESEDEGCERCGRTSHTVEDCYASIDIDGRRLRKQPRY